MPSPTSTLHIHRLRGNSPVAKKESIQAFKSSSKLERWDTNVNNKGYRVTGLSKQTLIQSTKYKPKRLFDSTKRGLCYSKHKADLPENQIQDLIVRVKLKRRLNLGLRRWLDG